MNPAIVCIHCGEPLIYLAGIGWVHAEGEGIYMQRCTACGHKAAIYPSSRRCPACGALEEWRNGHGALPDMSASRPAADLAFERARGRILGLPEKEG